MVEDPVIQNAVRLLAEAGCVFAEDEAYLIRDTARTPHEFRTMVRRRMRGLPLEQVVGWAEFCGLRISVDPGVFAPRRRSEFLVQTAAALAQTATAPTQATASTQISAISEISGIGENGVVGRNTGVSGGSGLRRTGHVVVDLCCGTGALGLAVAARLGRSELHAADIDPAAVACARRNVEPAGGRVYEGDLFGPLPPGLRGRVTTLLCNAPYVPTGEIALLPAEAREHEHRIALDGGADGLAVLRRAASRAPGWLARGGHLLVETSGRQAEAMVGVMSAAGLKPGVHECEDYGSAVVTGTLVTGTTGTGRMSA